MKKQTGREQRSLGVDDQEETLASPRMDDFDRLVVVPGIETCPAFLSGVAAGMGMGLMNGREPTPGAGFSIQGARPDGWTTEHAPGVVLRMGGGILHTPDPSQDGCERVR